MEPEKKPPANPYTKRVAELEAQLSDARAELAALTARVATLEAFAEQVKVLAQQLKKKKPLAAMLGLD